VRRPQAYDPALVTFPEEARKEADEARRDAHQARREAEQLRTEMQELRAAQGSHVISVLVPPA